MTDFSPTTETLKPSLNELLRPEKVDESTFFGRAARPTRDHVFGGQVVGQALMAAANTVDTDKTLHSLQTYFMRPGDGSQGIHYSVTRERDGRNFSNRRITARQNDKIILSMNTSFQRPELGLNHQTPMADITQPDGLLNEFELAEKYADQLPQHMRKFIRLRGAFEIKPLYQGVPFSDQDRSNENTFWFRARHTIGDNTNLQRATLAFASDMGLLNTAMRPHGLRWTSKNLQSASLDHCMWFHSEKINTENWLLYTMQSPWSGNTRGLNHGSIFTREGELIVTCMQEGLMRQLPPS